MAIHARIARGYGWRMIYPGTICRDTQKNEGHHTTYHSFPAVGQSCHGPCLRTVRAKLVRS